MIIYRNCGFVNNKRIAMNKIRNKQHRKQFTCDAVSKLPLFKFVEMIFQ